MIFFVLSLVCYLLLHCFDYLLRLQSHSKYAFSLAKRFFQEIQRDIDLNRICIFNMVQFPFFIMISWYNVYRTMCVVNSFSVQTVIDSRNMIAIRWYANNGRCLKNIDEVFDLDHFTQFLRIGAKHRSSPSADFIVIVFCLLVRIMSSHHLVHRFFRSLFDHTDRMTAR